MRTILTAAALAAIALTFAAVAGAAPGNGAQVVNDAGCYQTPFAKVCVVEKTTTNVTSTPSGNLNYVTNGTVERTMTFVFGGSYTVTDTIHSHHLDKQGEIFEESDHYLEQNEYQSGTYHLLCTEAFDLHWANGASQFGNYDVQCTVL
jgi:hypothetical protein